MLKVEFVRIYYFAALFCLFIPIAMKFPLGEFQKPENFTDDAIASWVRVIEETPAKLEVLVSSMSEKQLDSPYRVGGWTARQVVHHLADSHINSYTRFKLALTEDNPTIRPYEENEWVRTIEMQSMPLSLSLDLLRATHVRWVYLLERMTENDYIRTFHHPASKTDFHLFQALAMYEWHCRHHLAHVEICIR